MAIKLEDEYTYAEPATAEYPGGSFKNASTPTGADATPLEKRWANDILGFLDALMVEAGLVHSGAPDTALVSQRLQALMAILAAADVDRVDGVHIKVIDIGDWNMDTTSSVSVAHGLTASKIRNISAMIRPDDLAGLYSLTTDYNMIDASGTIGQFGDNIVLKRASSSFFDGTGFDSTSFNRGWITIWYVD